MSRARLLSFARSTCTACTACSGSLQALGRLLKCRGSGGSSRCLNALCPELVVGGDGKPFSTSVSDKRIESNCAREEHLGENLSSRGYSQVSETDN